MRKKILSIVLVAAMLAATLIGCGTSKEDSGAAGAPELTLIIASNQTSEDNPYSFGMDKFKETIENISDGKVTVTVHKGTLGENESDFIEKLDMGAVDLVVVSPAFMTFIGVPEVEVFSLYYIFNDFDHWERAVDGEFGNSMRDIVKEKTGNNFRIVSYWTSSVRDYYGKKQIVTPTDLKGMTIRTQSSQVQKDFWSACGAVPTSVAWGELYQALQQGVVDSAENDYTNFMQKEHHKTENGKFVSETHHDFTTRLLLMNGNRYDSLTDEQKGWIDEACKAATQEERQVTYKMFEESKQKVIADGAIVTNYEDIDIDAFKAVAIPIQDKFATEYNMQEQLEMIRKCQ